MQTTVTVDIFGLEPKECVAASGNKYEFYEYRPAFEAIFAGVRQKIKPFIALQRLKGSAWTEIGLGFVTENNETQFWSLYDFGQGRNSPYYPYFKKALDILPKVKVIQGNTPYRCYCTSAGQMTFNETFQTFKEIGSVEEKSKKRKGWLWLLLIAALIISLLMVFS
jgi:hypothetical protein